MSLTERQSKGPKQSTQAFFAPPEDPHSDKSPNIDPRRLLDLSPDLIFVVDDQCRVVYANQATETFLGVILDEWIGADPTSFIHPDDLTLVLSSIDAVQINTMGTPIEVRVKDGDGRWRWLEIIGRDCLDEPGIRGILCTGRDLTERRMWEIAASDVTRFQQVVQHSAAIILYLDSAGVVREVNGAVGRLLGHDPSLVVGSRLINLVVSEDRDRLAAAIISADEGRPVRVEVSMALADGSGSVPIRFEIVDMVADPVVAGIIVTGQDVTDLRNARRRLEHLATHDNLTGLANRALMEERLSAAIAADLPMAVLYVDLDGFKAVNDERGHGAGDELLHYVAERLTGTVSHLDTVARVGGDEFVVLAMGVGNDGQARQMADRIQNRLGEPFRLSTGPVHVQASVGAVVATPGRSAADLLNLADLDMYTFKLGVRP